MLSPFKEPSVISQSAILTSVSKLFIFSSTKLLTAFKMSFSFKFLILSSLCIKKNISFNIFGKDISKLS